MKLLKSLQNTITPSTTDDSDSEVIDLGIAFKILENFRRRHVIRILAEADEEMTLNELAQAVADVESTSQTTMRIALYQTHLPKLANAPNPVISYDVRAGTIKPTPTCHTLNDLRATSKTLLND